MAKSKKPKVIKAQSAPKQAGSIFGPQKSHSESDQSEKKTSQAVTKPPTMVVRHKV